MSAVPAYQPQQNVVVVQAQPAQQGADDGWQSSHKGGIRAMSILQVIAGTICVVFQISLTALYHATGLTDYGTTMSVFDGYVGAGIWCGGYFILTGALGLGSINRKGNCWVIAFLVLNIISCSVFVWTLLGLTSTSLGIVNSYVMSCHYGYGWSTDCRDSNQKTSLALNSIMLLMSVLQFVVTLTASIFGCINICCRSQVGQVNRYVNSAAPPGYVLQHNNGVHMPVHTGMMYGPQGYGVQTVVMSNTAQYPQQPPQPVGYAQQPVGYAQQPVGYAQQAAGYAQTAGMSAPPPYNPQPQEPQQHKY